MERWSGKVALVTGASSGIGRSIAFEFAKHGMKVVALARRKEKLDTLVNDSKNTKGSITTYKCDVRNPGDIKNAFELTEKEVGPISVLVNNAGYSGEWHSTEYNQEDTLNVMETNVIGLINCILEATAMMKKHKINEGHIINISSVCGKKVVPMKGLGIYTASKHAVTALSESLRNDYDKDNIRITNISPGLVETDRTTSLLEKAPDMPRVNIKNVTDCVVFALQMPQNVNISEITVEALGTPARG